MNKVVFYPEVRQYYKSLIPILYEKGYFLYEENAQKYVKELIADIIKTLPIRNHRPAPKHFERYGKEMFYASFRKSKHTTWYAFFTKYEDNGEIIYLIRYISNNHVVAQYL